jgi:tyrosine-protein kinase Etk/Wzc
MLIGILNSRTIAQAAVEKYKLRERYDVQYMQDAIKKLQDDMLKLDLANEGVISLTVRDWDPRLAADMANFYIEQADRVVSRQGRSEAGRQRAFIENQLVRTKASLARAEDALRRFQEKNRAIGLVEQTRGAIDAAARLKGEVIASEVQLQVMRGFATEANPDVMALRKRIDEMKRQLTQVQYGDNLVGESRPDFQVPFTKVPEVGLELIRLTRDVKVEETVMTLLTQQFEQTRITEAKDLPIVQILDVAVPADRHARPRLLLNVAVAAVISMMLAVLIALAVDYTQMARAARIPRS